ncbi:MAG: molybdate ABC transporter substrate-binding protein [Spirochaetes bacterium]|nr:molybdate ABC transporter substrate-binding protein [Spirochaetota bacterium]
MKKIITAVILVSAACLCLSAEEIYLASGAGYKRPVNEIAQTFKKETSITVNCIYGNMNQIIAQSKKTGKVSLMIGDSSFLKKSGISFVKKQELGKGKLVLAFPEKIKITSIEDLLKTDIKKIVLPDGTKAIYGKAAFEALSAVNIHERLKESDRLLVVQTVPQVTAYLSSGEADAGFLNITDCMSLDNKKFSYIEIDKKLYSPIVIECGLTSSADENSVKFYDYLKSDSAAAVFRKYGLSE